jgi:predicted porin
MQKKLISLAVAAAFTAPVAMADVTIYGKMHGSVDFMDNGDSSENNTGVLRQSRFGLKGSEDLGGGLKAIFQIESTINTNNYGFRNTFVGLAGDWGTALLGRHDTPYKLADKKLDPWSDTIGDSNAMIGVFGGGGPHFDERAPQTIAYVSPNFNGFTAAVAYVEHDFDNTGVDDDDDTAWSLSGVYNNGPLFLSAAYETHEGDALTGVVGTRGDGSGDSAWKLAGGYTFGDFMIGLVYENIEQDNVNDGAGNIEDRERDAWKLTGAYTFGNNKLIGTWGQADEIDDLDDTGATMWAIGLDHNFSKRTKIYGVYASMDNDDNATYRLQPPNHGLSDGYAPAAAGDDVDGFSVGVQHKF